MHSLKTSVRELLLRFAPQLATGFLSARGRAYSQRLYEEWGCVELNKKLIAQFGANVLAGPFSGVVLTPMTFREHLAPVLLGIYESELHEIWTDLFGRDFSQVVDIGAKIGYYAVGLARRFPDAEVFAFDPDRWARKAVREMAAANSTPKIRVLRFCSVDWFQRALQPGAFILSDCEGYERVLFGGPEIPALRSATMLIELHEQISPGVGRMIESAFSDSHRISKIPTKPLTKPPVEIANYSDREKNLAINEFRTQEQNWLYLVPISPDL